MLDSYMNNLESIISSIFFMSFKILVITLVSLLIISLILLAIGCLIKSQKIKSKLLGIVPKLLIITIFIIILPYIFYALNHKR